MTPKVHSQNFNDIPNNPAKIIQKVAPGPPKLTAIATPAIFPNPTVAAHAVHNACLWLTSPGALFSLLLKIFKAVPKCLIFIKPKYTVQKIAAKISHTTINGTFVSSNISIEKKTILTTSDDIGVRISLILASIEIAYEGNVKERDEIIKKKTKN